MSTDKPGEFSKTPAEGETTRRGPSPLVIGSRPADAQALRPAGSGPILGKMRTLAHLAAVGTISLVVLTGYHFFQTSSASVASIGAQEEEAPGGLRGLIPRNFAALGGGYRLSDLKNLHRADYYIREAYVDPDRVDPQAMFRSALEAVEREVPEVVLRLDGDPAAPSQRLYVQVNNYRTELTVQKITEFGALEDELKRVAVILEEHLDAKEHPHEDVEYAFINGMLGTLDPHSVFLPPESAGKMEEDNEGEFGGLGITIQSREGQLTIEYPLEDTPAYRAGLQAGDRILKIEGEGTLNMDLDEAVLKMRGAPNSPVTITVDRDAFESPRDFTIIREMIKPERVWGKLLDGGIGYVRLGSFNAQVDAQLEEELAKLERDAGPGGLKGLVLDMRDNPGGFLHQAVAVADKFLSYGAIVSTVERDGNNRETKEARGSSTDVKYPVAVLMSGNSASAAEIVAGALKNDERAVIIGERSFGKGSVQNLYPFTSGTGNDSKLKLTVERYLTPGDHSIQNVGIPPDIALDRSVVYPPREIKELKEMSGPRVSLFYRDRLVREADLAGHLVNDETDAQPTLYRIRYLSPDPEVEESPKTDRKDITKDFEVTVARDVLANARGARRADVLRDAAGVVAAREKAEAARLEAAFKGVGIDWSDCTNPTAADVRMTLAVGADNVLAAGVLTPVTLSVTNAGDKPVCRTYATSTSGNDTLDGVEYYFGKINPGETRSYTVKVRSQDGYPTEQSRVDLAFGDVNRTVLARQSVPVATAGHALPRYAWTYAFDDKTGGDGDGVVEVGETIHLKVDVMNVGEGDGVNAAFTLKKGEGVGRTVELVAGQASFEVPNLAVGARASGDLAFRVVTAPEDGALPMVFRATETKRYDYASIVKGGFSSYYTQEETFPLAIGAVAPAGRREPPSIQLTRAPELTTGDHQVTVSGVATDDSGIRDVIVYAGARKVAYAGGGDGNPLKSVPFSATTDLEDGNNLLVVLVRDVNGLTTTRSVNVYHPPTQTAAVPVVTPPVR